MQPFNEQTVVDLLHQVNGLNIPEVIQILARRFSGEVTFSTSFSMEDQVVTHQILQQDQPVSIFTLDTGRLFAETYSVWTSTLAAYGVEIQAYYPNAAHLQELVSTHGPNLFYESVALRKNCCQVRKVEPLQRALAGKKIWITGLRAAHSADRSQLDWLEWDAVHQLIKFHPLLHWNTDAVKNYISTNLIPYNPLHDRGFVSIGCAPCTRAIREGEDFRAGRWWWEDAANKECGLHVHANTESHHPNTSH